MERVATTEEPGRRRSRTAGAARRSKLKHYYYALTAHFGTWEAADGEKPVRVLLSDFVYSQVIKHQRRRKMVEVERRVEVGEAWAYAVRLRQAGMSARFKLTNAPKGRVCQLYTLNKGWTEISNNTQSLKPCNKMEGLTYGLSAHKSGLIYKLSNHEKFFGFISPL